MDFLLSDDQEALRDGLRRALAESCSSEVRRAAMGRPGAVDRQLWSVLAEIGVFGLCLADDAGGAGLGMADATIVFEELGRAAVPGPTIPSFLAAALIAGAHDGSVVVGAVERAAPALVEHLDGLDLLVIIDGDGVWSTPPGAAKAARALDRPFDPLTPVHLIDSLDRGELVAGPEEVQRWTRDGGLLVAAMQVGLAAAALDMAVDYAKQRQQFGRTIGSFQAIKHLLADVLAEVETARAVVQAAGVEMDEGAPPAQVERSIAAARILASRAGDHGASTCIQVHGGMGYTWELDAHLLLKRSLVLDTQFGGPDAALEAMARALA